MANLLLIVFCLLAGWGFRRSGLIPASGAKVLNTLVLYVSLPAITLLEIPRLSLEWKLLYPTLAAWAVFFGAWGMFGLLERRRVLAPATAACCILTAGLGNTSFVGFPLLKALYGQEALQYAILADQPGSFLLLSTFGLGLAARYRRAAASGPPVWKKLLRFPPFMAFGMGLLLIPVGLPAILKPLLEPLAATLTPLALLSVGLQWQPGRGHFSRRALALGLVYKLVAGPLLAWLLLRALGLSGGLMFEVAVLEAAMAPMITASIVAAEHELAPSLAYQMVGVGIPLSLVTVLLWYLLLAS